MPTYCSRHSIVAGFKCIFLNHQLILVFSCRISIFRLFMLMISDDRSSVIGLWRETYVSGIKTTKDVSWSTWGWYWWSPVGLVSTTRPVVSPFCVTKKVTTESGYRLGGTCVLRDCDQLTAMQFNAFNNLKV